MGVESQENLFGHAKYFFPTSLFKDLEMTRPALVLPPTYYHDHFGEMVEFIMSVYGDFLDDTDKRFIEDFNKLGQDAQCLFIRMINRKKIVFNFDDLNYGEIKNISHGLQELQHAGFTRCLEESDYYYFLIGLSKADLIAILKDHSLTEAKSSWSKPKLVSYIFENLLWKDFTTSYETSRYFLPLQKEKVSFLLYLYFGKLNDNLISFTLRDLGVVSVKAQEKYQARFQNIEEARSSFFYSQILKDIKTAPSENLIRLADDIETFPSAETEFTVGLRDAVLYKLGQFFEKKKDFDRAIPIYERSLSFDSRERLVRLLFTQGETERVKATLENMIANPANDEEFIFATDFYNRKYNQQKTGIFTDLLRDCHVIEVDDLYRGYPESAAIKHFAREGWSCHHTENGLWPTLFGLLFWDELFEAPDALSSGFDFVPHVLKNKTFHLRYAPELANKLNLIREGKCQELVTKTLRQRAGNDNGLFWWSNGLEGLIRRLLASSPPAAIAELIGIMAQDFYSLRDGFPDLMMTKGKNIKFIEIKGEGDQVRRNQLARLNLLKRIGFDADICRVKYKVDPDQTYVVVDVETTGGRPPFDRVTEVGAVKVKNGKVIGEWHSLINPERRIPSFITTLTGISNEMVQDAPVFAEIADDLEEFLGGSIFVAHNVNFDHGFIASEYRRLDRNFRYPKLCTVASMRRHYPGHRSYSLGSLCKEYQIELKNHHRALDDAKAASRLLCLVNEKRMAV